MNFATNNIYVMHGLCYVLYVVILLDFVCKLMVKNSNFAQ
jgi:hypothetical protein